MATNQYRLKSAKGFTSHGTCLRRPPRRGVVLLIIISLLSLFALVAITYVVSATQHRRAAAVAERRERWGTDPRQLLDSALLQLLCDTSNTQSVVFGHGILADMYGHYGCGGTISAIDTLGDNRLLMRLTVQSDPPRSGGQDNPQYHREIKEMGYLGGCVLTMLDGQCSGLSTHIVQQDLNNPNTLYVKTFVGDETEAVVPAAGDRFWINGVPFSGTGAGYNRETGRLDKVASGGQPVGLYPNFAGSMAGMKDIVERRRWMEEYVLDGGMNEEYDAPDWQNLFLAYVPDPPGAEGASLTNRSNEIVPSFHRPDLIRKHGGVMSTDIMRKVMFRPSKEDNPNFTGSNPRFDPMRGPWDVDNDHDLRPDSVWMDLGMPVMTGPDGRLVKPLFAVLCTAMNGGIDINASGNPSHTDAGGGEQDDTPTYGLGTGPGDINCNMLTGSGGGSNLYAKLAFGNDQYPGKYGRDRRPGEANQRKDRFWAEKFPEITGKWQWSPGKKGVEAGPRNWGSPPDIYGGLVFTLHKDDGQPLWKIKSAGTNPAPMYDIALGRNDPRGGGVPKAKDVPFSFAEYERFLRQYDGDARALPDRLWKLAEELRQHPRRFTVESYDVPCPDFSLPARLRTFTSRQLQEDLQGRTARTYVDLIRARLKAGGNTNPQRTLALYVPTEMLQGQKFDLNMSWGNGQDDDDNGVVDDHHESKLGEKFPNYDGISDLINDDPRYTTSQNAPVNVENLKYARQIYARRLYVMMMALMLPTENYDWTSSSHQERARQFAQWAVNVVDFRDPDFIMTRFTYDLNPFDAEGWNPTEGPQQAVFGVERPELIITETIAGHDRRTEDRNEYGKAPADNFDQRYRPLQWVFIELYNPWTSPNEKDIANRGGYGDAVSGELYKHDINDRQPRDGVVLDQFFRGNNGKPVWRLMFHQTDTFDEVDRIAAELEGDQARAFYFVPEPIQIPADGSRNNWDQFRTPNLGPQYLAPIEPGQCMVIGSRPLTPIGPYRGSESTDTVMVKLTPNSQSNVRQVEVLNNQDDPPPPEQQRKPPLACIVSQTRRGYQPGGISSPPQGYPDRVTQTVRVGGMATSITGQFPAANPTTELTGGYNPVLPHPLDSLRPDVGGLLQSTHPEMGYKIVYLQRLADPTQVFNTVTNPYRTIDYMPIDLYVYNSMEGDSVDPEDIPKRQVRFVTRERGETESLRPGGVNNLWSWERRTKAPGAPEGANKWKLYHTLGYVPNPLGPQAVGGAKPQKGPPFPWLTFFNRPFVNRFELMMVPEPDCSRLLREFNIVRPGTARDPYTSVKGDFEHLPNFFYNGQQGVVRTDVIRDLAMLLDFVDTPSPYVGTDTRGDPQSFKQIPFMKPPFYNKVSNYRVPGKVNLNVLTEQEAWQTLVNEKSQSAGGGSFEALKKSRQGRNSDLETISFERPFRAYGGADITDTENIPPMGTEVTLLRKGQRAGAAGQGLLIPLKNESGVNDPTRSPYFRYQRLCRAANTTTPRSNQFAIWITVGFFEVEPVPKSPANPDGFQLGQEVGWDNGTVERRRAFYIVDRTIPVACQPGRVHNVHKAIMVSRMLE